MAKSKRITFTFDQRSYDVLQRIVKYGGYPSMAAAVKESLQLARILQIQVLKDGFTEIVVRNPDSGEERMLIIPSLEV